MIRCAANCFSLNNTLAAAMTEKFPKYTKIATFLKRSFHFRIERKSQDRPDSSEHQYLEVRTSNSFIGYHNLIFRLTGGWQRKSLQRNHHPTIQYPPIREHEHCPFRRSQSQRSGTPVAK